MTPVFSLLHVTARPVWASTARVWLERADHPENLEYLLAVEERPPEATLDLRRLPDFTFRVVKNHGRPCTVDAWNAAAKASTGKVLVSVADDYFPPEHWDTLLLSAIPNLEKPYAVRVDNQDPWPTIMTHPILTRAYYEKPGRGGMPHGELLYPEYISVGSDDDFTENAFLDGVVIDACELKFEHRHPSVTGLKPDEVAQQSNRLEAWQVRERVLGRRRSEQFGRRKLKSLTVITPGRPFEPDWMAEWEPLYTYLLSRFMLYRVWGLSNNIYQVREVATRQALSQENTPDYVLWIDSDNPPKLDSFKLLLAQMQESEQRPDMPSIDIIGAWYRYAGPDEERSYIAAGLDSLKADSQLTEDYVLSCLERNELVEDIAFIGFGMLLMRGEVLRKLGPEGFWPKAVDAPRGYLMDDVSWCERARALGYRIFLHPGAFVEHTKLRYVPRGKNSGKPVLVTDLKQLKEIAS